MSSASAFSLSLLRRIYALLTPRQRSQGALTVVGIVFGGLLDVLGLAAILPVISIAVTPELIRENATVAAVYEGLGFQSETQFLTLLVLLMFSAFLLKNAIGLWLNFWQVGYTFEVAKSLSQRMFLLYFQRGYSFVRSIESGAFISNIKNVPSFFAQGTLLPVITLASEFFVVLIVIAGIALVDVRIIAVLALLVGGGFFLIFRSVRGRLSQINDERFAVAPQAISRINEVLQGYVDITLFQRTRFFLDRFFAVSGKEYELTRQMSFYGIVPPRANEVVIIAGISLIFLYGLWVVEERKSFFFLLGLIAAAAYRIMPSMNRVVQAIVTIRTSLYVMDVLGELTAYQEKNDQSELPLPFADKLEVKSLSYTYPGAERPVLDGIEFEVRKGEAVGFIGESGSGKSTLMRILLRLVQESGGEIRVDGQRLDEANRAAWQRNLGYVQQEIFLLDGTVLENIAFGVEPGQADEARVRRALEQAGLASFVESLPNGLQTYIGEYGSRLSGGQKQRIAIARALYQDASVFMFDEATSALDPETERVVSESISALAASGKTVFIIAHRLTTLHACSRIYELEAGKIAAVHSYDEMIRLKLGLVREKAGES